MLVFGRFFLHAGGLLCTIGGFLGLGVTLERRQKRFDRPQQKKSVFTR